MVTDSAASPLSLASSGIRTGEVLGYNGSHLAPAAPSHIIGHRVMEKLRANLGDVTIVVVGDSTSSSTTTWPIFLLESIAALFPAYWFKYAIWNDTEHKYPAATSIQTGTGEHTLTLYSASKGGENPRYQMAPYLNAMVADKTPDLIFVNHGHNEGSTNAAEPYWRDDLLALTETLNVVSPLAEIVLIAQNPRTVDTSQNLRQFVTGYVAQMRGYGFVNVWRAFVENSPGEVVRHEPEEGALIKEEGIHPNEAGYKLWANTVLHHMLDPRGGPPRSQQASALAVPVGNYLENGNFAEFASPPTLTHWTATHCTLSKDETNYESNGYAVKMVPAEAGQQAYMHQDIASKWLRRLRGGWVTVAVRMYRPTSAGTTVGKVSLIQTGGTEEGFVLNNSLSGGGGGFVWVTASRYIHNDATKLGVTIYAQANTSGESECTIDRAIVARGVLPRDITAP